MRVITVNEGDVTRALGDGTCVIVKAGDVVDLRGFDASGEVRIVIMPASTYGTCEATIDGETFKDAPIQIRAPRPHAPRRPKFDRSLAREHARRFR